MIAEAASLPILFQDDRSVVLAAHREFVQGRQDLFSNPNSWSSDISVYSPERQCNVRVYYLLNNVIAAQFDLTEFDISSATHFLTVSLARWNSTIPTTSEAPSPTGILDTTLPKPTLLALIIKLGDTSITTPEQRVAIRHVITDYLNNEISHNKVFSYLGQVVGYQVLENVINLLNDGISKPAVVSRPLDSPLVNRPSTDAAHSAQEEPHAKYQNRLSRFVRVIKWLKPNLSMTDSWGGAMVPFDKKFFMLGGRLHDAEERKCTATFQKLLLANPEIKSVEYRMTSQDYCPRSCVNHVACIGHFVLGPLSVVHGGVSIDDTDTKYCFLNVRTVALDMMSSRWIDLEGQSLERPPPRHSHSGHLLPASCSQDTMAYAEHFLIFGGIGYVGPYLLSDDGTTRVLISELTTLNDVWLFDFLQGSWKLVECSDPAPRPRFGMSLVWSSDHSMTLFGGEDIDTCSSVGFDNTLLYCCPFGAPIILGDCWRLELISEEKRPIEEVELTHNISPAGQTGYSEGLRVIGISWRKLTGCTPRSHYAVVGVTALISLDESRCTADFTPSVSRPFRDGFVPQRYLIYIAGLTSNVDKNIFCTSSVMIGLVTPNDIVWQESCILSNLRGMFEQPFTGRQGLSACFLDTISESSIDVVDRNSLDEFSMKLSSDETSTKKPQSSEYSTVSTISNSSSQANTVPCIFVWGGKGDKNCNSSEAWVLTLSDVFPKFCKNPNHLLDGQILSALLLSQMRSTNFFKKALKSDPNAIQHKEDDVNVLRSIWCQPENNYDASFMQLGFAAVGGLLWTLASGLKNPLTAFGVFVDNSTAWFSSSKNVSIALETWRGKDCITICDDGSGVPLAQMHIMLKRFGHQCDDLIKRDPDRYGVGFKLGVGRLAHNALVFTQTEKTFGVGLFSAPLQSMMGNSSWCCPILHWHRNDGVPHVSPMEEKEFGQSLNLILKYSPLGSISALKEELSRFNKTTGCKIVLFGLRRDIPYPQVVERNVIFSGFDSLRCPSLGDTLALTNEIGEGIINETQIPGTARNFDLHVEPVDLNPNFPFYSSWAHSIDYSLATYLYWLQMHLDCNLFLNGTHLSHKIPNLRTSSTSTSNSGIILPETDSYAGSLYRFLQNKLNYVLEFPFLGTPKHGEDNFHGIVGFINDPLSHRDPELCEAGVLFYHDCRLITRGTTGLPYLKNFLRPPTRDELRTSSGLFTLGSLNVTAAINVPKFLTPRYTREGFLSDSYEEFQGFYDIVEEAIKEYLDVYSNSVSLAHVQNRYTQQFDQYRETMWNQRREAGISAMNFDIPQSGIEPSTDGKAESDEDMNGRKRTVRSDDSVGNKGKRRRHFPDDRRRKRRGGSAKKLNDTDTETLDSLV